MRLSRLLNYETAIMKFLLWLFVFIVIFFMWARYVERHSLYFPVKDINFTPQVVGLPYEEACFDTSDGKRLYGWFIPAGGKAKFTVLFCHGNGGNISHRLEKIGLLHGLGLNVFIFDYRGYGKSEGAPSEPGLYKDADAAYKYLVEKRNIPKDGIILYGESLGGTVAAELATKESARAIITEEAFTSVPDMTGIVYPFIPRFVISTKFDTASKMKDATCPKLIIHSVDDEIVPFSLGEKLFKAASPPKEFLEIRGSHNTAFFDSKEQFTEGIRSFLDGLSSQEVRALKEYNARFDPDRQADLMKKRRPK